jgi:feruloyl esterase
VNVRRIAALTLLALALAPAGALLAVAEPAESQPSSEDCAVLAALDFAEAVGAAVTLSASAIAATDGMPPRCRVTGTVAPETGVEIWLPLADWNGKLFAAGCYGLCGSIRPEQMADAAARGYATVTHDGGHSETRYPDSRWALDNTALEDQFGHLAGHRATALAKALVRAFYGDDADYAYFRGCSTGGRQALVAASRYPEDYDGIIAGAPFHQLLSVPHMIWVDRVNTGGDGKPLLDAAAIRLLHRAVLARCDAGDGAADGVIGDPERCDFDPASLACPAEPGDADCLGPAQVSAVRAIYAGPADSSGRRLAPFGAARGSEFTWEQQILGHDGKPSYFASIGRNWQRYHAYEPDPGPAAEPVFHFDKDPVRLAAGAARVHFGSDLAAFAARDGRLLVHHGWADESLQPAHTLAWWREVQRANGGAADVARFARLYMLPGVLHCGGGPGAGDVDWLTVLERWVEGDVAPGDIDAIRTQDSAPALQRQPRFPPTGAVLGRQTLRPYR